MRFTVQKVFISNDGSKPMIFGKTKVYEYNKDDMLYYNEDTDEDWYMEKPMNGKKSLSLKLGYHARILVRNI